MGELLERDYQVVTNTAQAVTDTIDTSLREE